MERKKLPMKVKLSLAVGSWGGNLLILLNTYFLMYFYTDVVKIPSGAVSVILLVARVWDAVNDPMMGALVDRTVSREGKSRFWLKYFSVPAGVALFLSYFCPEINTMGKVAWVTVTYILQGMTATVISVSGNALVVRVTDDPKERVQIGQLGLVGNMVLTVVISSLTLPMANALGNGSLTVGFAVTAAIYSVFYAASKLVSYWGSRGFDEIPAKAVKDDPASVKSERIPLKVLICATISNRYALLVSAVYVCYLLVSAIMGSTMVYYFQYNLKNTGLMSLYSAGVSVGCIVGIVCMGLLHKKFGNSGACAFCGILVIVGCLIRLVTGDQVSSLFVLSMVILGMGSGLVGSFCSQCVMDSCTWAKLKRGDSNQAMVMSVFTFAQKMGQALGGVVAAWLLTLVPYEVGAADQADSVIKLFYLENITLPMVLAAVMVIGFLFVRKYERELNELKAQREGGRP